MWVSTRMVLILALLSYVSRVYVQEYRGLMGMGLDHALLCVACFFLNLLCDMCGDLFQ